jgi:hypothetical protein
VNLGEHKVVRRHQTDSRTSRGQVKDGVAQRILGSQLVIAGRFLKVVGEESEIAVRGCVAVGELASLTIDA